MSKKASRAAGPHRHETVSVPIGIEKLLCCAAGDPAFRKALQADRRGTVERHGVELTESEQRVFYGTPDAVLDRMIERIDLPRHGRRNFMKSVASVALAASTTLSISCGSEPAGTGVGPSPPTDITVEIDGDASVEIDGDANGDAESDILGDTSSDESDVPSDAPADQVAPDAEN